MSNKNLGPKTIQQAIEGMTLSLDPNEAKELDATIQFNVSGEGGGNYYLTITDGKCTFSEGSIPNPTLTIETPADIWLKIARKEMKGAMALMTGKYKASGQMSLLMKMDKIFSRKPIEAELLAVFGNQ
ncbi:MAG: SCP2 sterol-binding domain-containing protein [Anaerolineae bacterium]|jgi:putative sterol carrier protein|nr:SCP2 sterol-binding domain-containing protein [Anaerolineae bacterium]MBT7069458.1 SCP2 sterol-binding domain-containing protein [Anaerolineae bacterium]MBT7325139.1 SCP2 sterol-binding domain-containing protein [Anaerolineae bacterium]